MGCPLGPVRPFDTCRGTPSRKWITWAISVQALLALLAAPVRADDAPPAAQRGNWPQWRGPRRDNVSDDAGLLRQWPKEGPPLAWKATGLGAGYADISVVAGRIYTMGDLDDACYVLALDEATGKRRWAAKVGPAGGGNGYPGPRCTPTVDPVDGRHVYALGQHGDLVCLESDTGKEVWRRHMKNDFNGLMVAFDIRGRPTAPWGYSESPLIDGDRLVCTPGGSKGTLLALDKHAGKVLWRTKEWTDSAVYCSPVPADFGGVRQYVQLTGYTLAGVDAQSGKVLWQTERAGGPAVVPTPVVWDDKVFITSGYGIGSQLYRVTRDAAAGEGGGSFHVERLYWSRALSNHLGGVVRVGEFVYGAADPGLLVCLDLTTGEARWKDRSVGKGSVTAADGMIYLRSESAAGTVALVEATPAAYRERGRFNPPDRSPQAGWPPPVVTGGRLYLRDQDVLLCYDVRDRGGK